MEYIYACMFHPEAKEGELSITWELNYKCKIECPICCNYSDKVGADVIKLTSKERIAIAYDIVNGAKKLHIVEVYLTGGEPLEDPSFPHIMRILSEARINLYMASTLYPLARNEELINVLVYATRRSLKFIHINGLVLSYQTNKEYQELKRLIKRLSNLGVHFRIGLPIAPFSPQLYDTILHRIFEIINYFDEISIYPLIPSGRAIKYYEFFINHHKIHKLLNKVIKKITNVLDAKISVDTRRIAIESIELKPLTPCPADRLLHITPSGAVYPCSWFAKFKCDAVLGLLPKETLNEVAHSERRRRLITFLRNRKPVDCKNCIFRDICGYGCPIMSLIYWGSINRADPLCPLTLKRNY